jgi:hypothetical protein
MDRREGKYVQNVIRIILRGNDHCRDVETNRRTILK